MTRGEKSLSYKSHVSHNTILNSVEPINHVIQRFRSDQRCPQLNNHGNHYWFPEHRSNLIKTIHFSMRKCLSSN